jgi:hypothetical protein
MTVPAVRRPFASIVQTASPMRSASTAIGPFGVSIL